MLFDGKHQSCDMTERKHILIISQYFYPESFRINDISRELVKRGYRVTVVTGIPNYPEGRFYKGYGLFKRRTENWDGIRIIRLPILSRGRSSVRLVLNYYSFVVSGWFWSHFTRVKADTVFSFETSPMTQVLVGEWYSRRRKLPHCVYVQDLWPDNLEAVGGVHNRMILQHYQRLSDRLYRNSSVLLATSPSFVEAIRQRLDSNEKEQEKVRYFPQYAEDCYRPQAREKVPEIPDDARFKIVFTGNIGNAQGLEILPKTARLLREDVCFVIVGSGRSLEKLRAEAADVQDRFLFIDRQAPERIPALLAACDVAFVSFMDNPVFRRTIPAKLQSYMACGMPILASASGETERVVSEADCGVCCELGNAEALAEGIERLRSANLSAMGRNALAYAERHFNKAELIGQLCSILDPEQPV